MPGRVRPSCSRGPLLSDALGREFSSPSPNRLPVGQKDSHSETSQPAAPWWVRLLSKTWSMNMGMEDELREAKASSTSPVLNFTKGHCLKGWLLLVGAGIKAQICSLVELLATTLNQAHALFYTLPEGLLPDPSLPCGLLFSTLETITGQHPTGECLTNLFLFFGSLN